MRHTLFISAVVLLALSSCTTYTAPSYVEPANPVDTTGIDPNKAKSPSFLILNQGGSDVGGNPQEQRVLVAKKTKVGTDTRVELKMQFLLANTVPHTITMVIPDYKGKGIYGKDQKFEYANVTMQVISNTFPQTTWQGEAQKITVDVTNDNAKYIEVNFSGPFDIYTPQNGNTGTTDLYGTWLVRWEL